MVIYKLISMAPEENEKQVDCQQKSTGGGGGREKLKGISVRSHERKARNMSQRGQSSKYQV